MFSYRSNKNSQTTYENDLIDEIQFIANQIFEPHSFSIIKTQPLEMSLQLSPPTSQQADSQIINHPNQDDPYLNYFTNTQDNKRHFQQPFSNHKYCNQLQKQIQSQFQKQSYETQIKQQQIQRLTKSMLSSNHFKEPASFSRNFIKQKNMTASQLILHKKKNKMNFNIQKQKTTEKQALASSKMNKSNILMGLINQSEPNIKKNNKRGKFSQSFSSNYVSPYSTRGMKENPKYYIQKSISQRKKPKQALEIQYIKKKINQNIKPQISHLIAKSQKQKSKSPKLSNVKSKYRQTRPLIHQYRIYAQQHIYKQMKQQMQPWHTKKKQYQIFTNQQIQNNWKSFIQSQQNFVQKKKEWLAAKKLQKFQQEKISLFPSSNHKSYDSDRNSKFDSNLHKMTPQDFVKKYKREKEKLKQKLYLNQISHFLDRPHFDSIQYNPQIAYSTHRNINDRDRQQQIENIIMREQNEQQQKEQRQSNKNDQKILRQLLIQNTQPQKKKGWENFFNSAASKVQSSSFKNISEKKSFLCRQDAVLAQSSVYYEKRKSTQGKTSRDSKTQRMTTEKSTKRKDVNSLCPFKSRQNYFTKQQKLVQDNSNESIRNNLQKLKRNSKQYLKKVRSKQNKSIKQLVKPKYFKSITQMQNYSHNLLQRNSNIQRTYQTSHKKIQQNHSVKPEHHVSQKQKQFQTQRQSKNQLSKNMCKGKKFDQNLMDQIINDLNSMRSQIQENKKNRKYKIQNYSNFTNLIPTKKQQIPQQQTGSFNLQFEKQQHKKRLHFNLKKKDEDKQLIQRNNKHFNITQEQKQLNQKHDFINHSRSISPVQQEKTILEKNSKLQVSEIFNEGDSRKKMKSSRFLDINRQIDNKNLILVKRKQEMQFIIENQQNIKHTH